MKPDDRCTPGKYENVICQHRTRPVNADRKFIVNSYGVPGWSGRDGELDHRVPFFLGGLTDRTNIWPEVGTIPNAKDKLEFYTYDRVCVSHTMKVSTARKLFMGDWTVAYLKYFSTLPRTLRSIHN